MNQPASPRKSFRVAFYVLIALIGIVIAAAGFVATRPSHFRIERSAQIDAPADAVFPLINDLHQWERWSPYEKFDPNMRKTFDEVTIGPGASYAWSGNNQAGEGRLTIVESKPAELVSMKLEFTRPFACQNQVNFTLVPSGDGTQVSWIMEGDNSFTGKAFSACMDMDRMVGQEFENGLTNLNTLAKAEKNKQESATQDPAADSPSGAANPGANP